MGWCAWSRSDLGSWAGRFHTSSAALRVGNVEMGSLGRLSFMRFVPGTGILGRVGKGGVKGIHVY